MRYPAAEKLEIIRIVEQSHLPVRRTLEQIGLSRATFYRWYDRYQTGGPEALGVSVRGRGVISWCRRAVVVAGPRPRKDGGTPVATGLIG